MQQEVTGGNKERYLVLNYINFLQHLDYCDSCWYVVLIAQTAPNYPHSLCKTTWHLKISMSSNATQESELKYMNEGQD